MVRLQVGESGTRKSVFGVRKSTKTCRKTKKINDFHTFSWCVCKLASPGFGNLCSEYGNLQKPAEKQRQSMIFIGFHSAFASWRNRDSEMLSWNRKSIKTSRKTNQINDFHRFSMLFASWEVRDSQILKKAVKISDKL